MGIVERKERDRTEMRRHILAAARTLFLEQGYDKTSIRNIADAIEYSPATIYLYYKDKNELLFALHREAFEKLNDEFAATAQIHDPFEHLLAMGRHYFKFAFENPELYDLMFVMTAPMETLDCREEVWEDGKNSFGQLKAIVQGCFEAGYFKNQEVEDLALMIWSFVHGLATLYAKKRLMIFPLEEQQIRMAKAFDVFAEMLAKA